MAQNTRKGEELDEKALCLFLGKNGLISDVRSPLDVHQFQTGFSNLTYLLTVEGKEFVLRRPPAGAVKRGHDMSREFKVLTGLNKGFEKAPKVYAYTEDTDVIGASFYLMEKMEGIILTMKEAQKREISSDAFPTIAKNWLDTLVELHQLDYNALGLADLGRPDGYVNRQVFNWGKQYLKAATEEIPMAEKVIAWLEKNQPTSYDHRLIHNDYKYDNVVFADDSWEQVNAVLDWEMSTLGDPLMDLGTTLAYFTMSTDSPFILQGFPSPTSLVGNPGRVELAEMYAEKTGRPLKKMVFYYAFGLFKIAVIVQQIYYRYSKGLTKDPRFARLNEATKLFTMMAWEAIQKNRIERLF